MENRTNFVQLDQTGKKYLPHIWYGQKDTPQEGGGGGASIFSGCFATDKGGNLILPIAQ